jgi:hypothetical protein
VGRTFPSLEAVQLLRPAALSVSALGWYGSSGGACDLVLADRVVLPPDLAARGAPGGANGGGAHAAAAAAEGVIMLPPSFQINFLPLLQPAVSVDELATTNDPAAAARPLRAELAAATLLDPEAPPPLEAAADERRMRDGGEGAGTDTDDEMVLVW